MAERASGGKDRQLARLVGETCCVVELLFFIHFCMYLVLWLVEEWMEGQFVRACLMWKDLLYCRMLWFLVSLVFVYCLVACGREVGSSQGS